MGVFLLAIFLNSCSEGLSDYQKKSFIKFYGSYQTDIGKDVVPLSGGGYALTGCMIPDSIPQMFLIITDEFGNQTENSPNYYGGELASSGNSILEIDDGGFLIAGEISDTLGMGIDVFIVKTDASGEVIWSETYGGANKQTAAHIIKRNSGGYVIAGKSEVNNGVKLQEDLWIIMIDSDGNKISEFTGNNQEEDDEACFIHNTGTSYLVACTYNDGAFEGKDNMVLNLDENCNLFDAIAMGTDFDDFAKSIVVYNGAYLLMGNSDNTVRGYDEIGLYTFSLEGNLIKNATKIATIFESKIDFTGEACVISSNGNIAVVGDRYEVNNDIRSMLLQFVDGSTIGEQVLFGQEGVQSGYGIKKTLDGGLVLVGSNGLGGNSVVSLVKTDAKGAF